jgi:hypothetical protein
MMLANMPRVVLVRTPTPALAFPDIKRTGHSGVAVKDVDIVFNIASHDRARISMVVRGAGVTDITSASRFYSTGIAAAISSGVAMRYGQG